MRKFILLTVVVALMMMMAAPLQAVDQNGRMGLSYRFGLHSVMKDPWAMKFMHGAEVKFGLHQNVAIAVTGTYARTDGAMFDLTGAQPIFVDAEKEETLKLRNYIIEIGPVFNFISKEEANTNVYVTTGVGLGYWSVQDQAGNIVRVADGDGNMFEVKDQQITLMLGAGFEYFLIPEFSLGGALRYHIFTSVLSDYKDITDNKDAVVGSDGLDVPSGLFEFGAVATAYFGKCKDDDKDGICNDDDKCPETPANCVVDEFGCEIDSDGDGVCDGRDKCPDTMKGCKVDMNGCPLDSDMDGVCDGVDQCPGTPTIAKVDANGCPLDTDRDGVPDYKDKCPGTPYGCLVDADGCQLDSDKDGVCDGLDKCPGTPAGYEVDAVGCPTGFEIKQELVLTDVTFVVNRWDLTNKAKKSLDAVVDALKALPHVELEIQGHTDVYGTKDWNLELSQKRAESVLQYFIDKGLEKSRFSAMGYGPDKPKHDNNTAKGRKLNRRVQLVRKN